MKFSISYQTAFFGGRNHKKYAETATAGTPRRIPTSDILGQGCSRHYRKYNKQLGHDRVGFAYSSKSLRLGYNIPVDKVSLKEFKQSMYMLWYHLLFIILILDLKKIRKPSS